jgi:UDP-glucose:(heptosyl)LPS alpha-1,3-glucosyltransferase
MRIALVCEHVELRRGGAEASTLQFARHLLDHGIDVELVTRSAPPPCPGLRVHVLKERRALRGLRSAAFARAADDLIARLQPDVVHGVTLCLSADVYEPRGGALPESVARNVALRLTAPGRVLKRATNWFDLKQRSMLALEHRLMTGRRPPRLVAISDYVARQFVHHYGLSPAAVFKSFNGVDPPAIDERQRQQWRRELRRSLAVDDGEPLVLLVAHNFKLKGVANWLRAMAALEQPLRSVIVGRDHSEPYERLAERLGVSRRVTFAGNQSAMEPYYSAADLLVHPTYYDPCSRVVLEALLWGLPCVTTRFNGAAEVLEDGITGRVIADPDDTAALAAAAAEASAASYRQALAERQPRLRHDLSAARHAAEVIRLYESVARERMAGKAEHGQAAPCAG